MRLKLTSVYANSHFPSNISQSLKAQGWRNMQIIYITMFGSAKIIMTWERVTKFPANTLWNCWEVILCFCTGWEERHWQHFVLDSLLKHVCIVNSLGQSLGRIFGSNYKKWGLLSLGCPRCSTNPLHAQHLIGHSALPRSSEGKRNGQTAAPETLTLRSLLFLAVCTSWSRFFLTQKTNFFC